MDRKDRISKAFDVLVDTCKQVLTLATGIIVITATFTHDFLGHVSGWTAGWLWAGWGLFMVSVAGGVLVMLAVTGTLAEDTDPEPYAPNIRTYSLIQLSTFGLGLVATIVFGIQVSRA
jgi:hypothetical protein